MKNLFPPTPALLVGLPIFIGTTHAASLEVGFQVTIGSEQNALSVRENGNNSEGGPYFVSVHPENSGYASVAADLPGTGDPADAFQRSFSGPVLGWSFIGGARDVLTIGRESGGLITYTTTDTVFDGFAQDQLTLWTESDPGPDLLNPENPRDSTGPGYRSFGQIEASIDISALGAGTVNIFYGAFSATPVVSVVMKDTDGPAPDITVEDVHLNGDRANRAEYYVAEVDFVNDAGYDVIEYIYLGNGVDDTGNGRFGGTVLSGASVAPFTLAVTDFSYDLATGTFAASITGASNTSYILVEAEDLEFEGPNARTIELGDATASVGTVAGNTIVTDENGTATIEGVAFEALKNSSFIRVEVPRVEN